jgi:predicted peroxiredoxin
MSGKAVISLTTGLEDAEKVTVAFLVAVGAAESGRPTLMFLTKEAVRLAINGTATGVACEGCPSLAELVKRYEAAGGRTTSARSVSTPRTSTRQRWSTAPNSRAPSRCGHGSATSPPPSSATDPRGPQISSVRPAESAASLSGLVMSWMAVTQPPETSQVIAAKARPPR